MPIYFHHPLTIRLILLKLTRKLIFSHFQRTSSVKQPIFKISIITILRKAQFSPSIKLFIFPQSPINYLFSHFEHSESIFDWRVRNYHIFESWQVILHNFQMVFQKRRKSGKLLLLIFFCGQIQVLFVLFCDRGLMWINGTDIGFPFFLITLQDHTF